MSTHQEGATMSTDTKLPESNADEQEDTEIEVVNFDDLRGDRDEQYNKLVQDSARMVRSGLLSVEDCRPATMCDDGQQPSDQFIQRLQDDIEAELEQLTPVCEERESNRKETKTTVNVAEIDWPRLWVNAGVAATKPLSWTQAALAVDVSEQTPISSDGAKEFIKNAINEGVLESFENHRVKPVESGANE
jgi:hypothetical protein